MWGGPLEKQKTFEIQFDEGKLSTVFYYQINCIIVQWFDKDCVLFTAYINSMREHHQIPKQSETVLGKSCTFQQNCHK